jgi:Rod binding domain-containing protein
VSLPISSILSGPATSVLSASGSADSTGARPAELAKLGKAAGEFESMLLKTLWKSMKETFTEPVDKDSDLTLENFDDFGMQAMAGVVGGTGALGIKSLILKHLVPTIEVGGKIDTAA